ncbi:hypothetical protein GCM10023080_013190 [Streptomyces pseudoechinosporeus]
MGVPPRERSRAWGSVQLQGGGGSDGGVIATDDNAADVRARPRDAALQVPVGLSPFTCFSPAPSATSAGGAAV